TVSLQALAFGVFRHAAQRVLRGVQIAGWIGHDPFPSRSFGTLRFMARYERDHLAVPGTADANALLPPGVGCRRRIRIDHVQLVVFVDEQAAGTAELPPLVEELAVQIENLQARVATIAHKQAAP